MFGSKILLQARRWSLESNARGNTYYGEKHQQQYR